MFLGISVVRSCSILTEEPESTSACRMSGSPCIALCGIVAWALATCMPVVAFDINDLFVPVDMHEWGGTDPLEQQVWELAMAPIEDTSLVTCTKRVHGETTGAWVNAPPVYINAGVDHSCSAPRHFPNACTSLENTWAEHVTAA